MPSSTCEYLKNQNNLVNHAKVGLIPGKYKA